MNITIVKIIKKFNCELKTQENIIKSKKSKEIEKKVAIHILPELNEINTTINNYDILKKDFLKKELYKYIRIIGICKTHLFNYEQLILWLKIGGNTPPKEIDAAFILLCETRIKFYSFGIELLSFLKVDNEYN